MPTPLLARCLILETNRLEEAKGADLLLHVVDSSHPEYRVQYDTVNRIVDDLDMGHIPQAIIFNKIRINSNSKEYTTFRI